MANAFNAKNNTWRLDAVYDAEAPEDGGAYPHPVYVKTVALVGGTAGDDIILQNFNSAVAVFERKATAADSEFLVEDWWYDGFKLTTLDGGVLFINAG